MKELVVISGKGGTGKTSLSASFAVLANRPVVADCDVDAADLHLLLAPRVQEEHEFRSGHEAIIFQEQCTRCGACLGHCRFDAVRKEIQPDGRTTFHIDPLSCEGCGVCVRFCPVHAIDFPERVCGGWMISDTRCGPMVHARLGAAAENSGKLVSVVRKEAARLAEDTGRSLVIVDGPPGIGCPVIASVTGATQVLVVTEPTVSGDHDMERVLSLTRHFTIPTAVCVNKWDINEEMTEHIEEKALQAGALVAGRIPYDTAVTVAQMQARTVVETVSPVSHAIRNVWDRINREE